MNDTTKKIELEGSGSICRLARDLIKQGHNPETLVEWTRLGQPVFKQVFSLGKWAEWRVQENDEGLRFKRLSEADWLPQDRQVDTLGTHPT